METAEFDAISIWFTNLSAIATELHTYGWIEVQRLDCIENRILVSAQLAMWSVWWPAVAFNTRIQQICGPEHAVGPLENMAQVLGSTELVYRCEKHLIRGWGWAHHAWGGEMLQTLRTSAGKFVFIRAVNNFLGPKIGSKAFSEHLFLKALWPLWLLYVVWLYVVWF